MIAITGNHKTLLMPGLIEYFERTSSLHKYDSDHKQVQACGNVTNVTNDYKRLRILEKFLRSYVYEWRGTPMLCPKSPHRLCQALSISVGCHCQYLSAVTVNIYQLSLSKFDTTIIMPLSLSLLSSSHGSQCSHAVAIEC